MKNISKIFFLTIIFFGVFALARSSEATTYYVSTTGSGTTCSTETPCAMIYGVNTKSTAGDTIIFKDGTYNTNDQYSAGYLLYITRGGTAGNVKTLKAENKWGAVLDGQNTAECVSFTKNASYIRIENFEIKNCNMFIVSADTVGATHNTIYGNYMHHSIHHGIDLAQGSHYFTIDSNIISDLSTTNPDWNTYGVYVADSTSNTTIINNVFYDIDDGWHIHLYEHGSPTPQSNTKIINNTFADESTLHAGHILIATKSPNILIENNIFYNPTTSAIRMYTDNTGNTLTVSNNLTNTTSICSSAYSGDCSQLTLLNNQVSTNPAFTNASGGDYTLLSNSPAINNGLASYAPAYDILNISRDANPDIGAYEYVPDVDITAPASPTGLSVQ